MKKTLKKSIVTCILSTLIMPVSSWAAELNKDEKAILAYVDEKFDEQVDFLKKVVTINSGTFNLKGVREVGGLFDQEFEKIGFDSNWIPMPDEMERAGHLHSEIKGSKGNRILLLGHLDTVFPKNSPFQKVEHDDNRISGPGISDMKNGDVVILYALKALHENGLLKDRQIAILLTGDEENSGQPLSISRKDMIDIAKRSDVAINFETGRQNQAVIARRGSSGWSLEVTGKRAHSSGIFKPGSGAGAIYEAARILDRFYAEIRGEPNLTFNPGVIAGGTFVDFDKANSTWSSFGKTNVIAQTVKVQGDLRFISEEQKARVRKKMRQIVATSLPKTSAEIKFTDKYPSMPLTNGNKALLDVLDQTSKDLGYGPILANDPGSRGAADISFVAPHVASIDGLGSWGGGAHAPGEWIDIKGFKMATKRAALYLYRLSRSEDENQN